MIKLAADFETSVYDGIEETEVWAAAWDYIEIPAFNAQVFNSIDKFFNSLFDLNDNIICYFHNLKFDGEFILSYLARNDKFNCALINNSEEDLTDVSFKDVKELANNEYKYIISSMGQWYIIYLKYNDYLIEFRDSLKLLPFSIKVIGETFKTTYKKSNIEYTGKRFSNQEITEDEKYYISADVYILKEALNTVFKEGHNSLTIGACCLKEYKKIIRPTTFKKFFPDLFDIQLPENNISQYKNYDEYIRKSYRGGWCYLKAGCEHKIYNNGYTFDVNSLYPSVMNNLENIYPVGEPKYINDVTEEKLKFFRSYKKYYFIRIKCRFKLRKNMLPTIQIKDSIIYRSNEYLETSDIRINGKYYRYYYDDLGNKKDTKIELVLTWNDYELIKKHYKLFDLELCDCVYYERNLPGSELFGDYLNKYKAIKENSTGGKRTLAKLYSNNLYGKFAKAKNSSFKVAVLGEDEVIHYFISEEYNSKILSIAIGSAITSYARNYTINYAQKYYNNFIYADTDSIHVYGDYNLFSELPKHDTEYGYWKLENSWEKGIFIRQKTYIEYDGKYIIKCAGMPDKCKQLLINSFTQNFDENKLTDEELEFCTVKRSLKDFDYGLIIPGKLMVKRIKGGVILYETDFELRENYRSRFI